MKLRLLKNMDAQYMLEWMHDPTVVGKMQADFLSKTIDDCRSFIISSQNTEKDLHLAIVNDEDIYMGTVSLKHIHDGMAEFAITVRSEAMGKDYASFGMKNILEYGFKQLNLEKIYWCVSPTNKRAVRFYDKNGYTRTNMIPESIHQGYGDELLWYVCDGSDTE